MLQKSDYEALVYSYDETLGVKRMRRGEYPLDAPIDRILHYMDKHDIQYIIDGDWQYAAKIESIQAKPYILYSQWNKELLNLPLLAIVGPRSMSSYAKRVLDELFPILSLYNVWTISWAAIGVDTYVHALSLRYAIPTVAVLGGWLAHYHQTSQRAFLSSLVQAGGLLISEYPLRKKPEVYTFPARNRIIAWLASVVFVPEAGEKSWSLITVDFAHQRKKPIYAVMWDIFSSTSAGTNMFIEQWRIVPLQSIGSFLEKHFTLKVWGSPKKVSSPMQENKPTYASPSEMFVAHSLEELGL